MTNRTNSNHHQSGSSSRSSRSSRSSPVADSASHVRVVARIRPLSKTERQRGSKEVVNSLACPAGLDAPSIHSNEPELIQTAGDAGGDDGNKRWFELDAVFDSDSTQEQVYQRSGTQQAVCEDIFKGYNATILAYGQTGSGKTHTMGTAVATTTAAAPGENGSSSSNDNFVNLPGDGMIPRACVDLFRNVRDKCDGNALVELSYLEIYNEEIRDLLAPEAAADPRTNTSASNKKSKPLKIRETLNGEVYVSGLTAVPVSSPAAIGQLMEQASKRRVVASTKMNAVSSRSHAICTLTISGVIEHSSHVDEDDDPLNNKTDKENNNSSVVTNPSAAATAAAGTQKFTSKLTLVDLAGSERIKKTGAAGNRRQEGISINKGLFVLGQVVSALSEAGAASPKKKSFTRKPPYRDSILTRLLQNSLGGNSRTIMVACVSPADYNLDESINTLRYATSARKIQSHATRNLVTQLSPEEAAALQRQNQLLQNQVAELQATVRRLTESQERRSPSPVASTISLTTDDSSLLSDQDGSTHHHHHDVHEHGGGGGDGHPEDEVTPVKQSPSPPPQKLCNLPPDEVAAAEEIAAATAAAQQEKIEQLEQKVSSLRKELRESRRDLQESTSSALEMPSLKVEVELLKEELTKMHAVQAENADLRHELTQQRADADSARHAASKLSDLLDHLKKLRRDEIAKKKEELNIMKKDEAWALFMSTMLEGRMDQMSSLVLDFDLFKNVLQESKVSTTTHNNMSHHGGGGEGEPSPPQPQRRKWFGGGSSHGSNNSNSSNNNNNSWHGGRRTAAPATPKWDPAVRDRMIMDHVEYFLTRLVEISHETKEECASLREMRASIVRECGALQDEIGKEEVEEDKLDQGDEDHRADMLEKLKEVLKANRTPAKAKKAAQPPRMSPIKEKALFTTTVEPAGVPGLCEL